MVEGSSSLSALCACGFEEACTPPSDSLIHQPSLPYLPRSFRHWDMRPGQYIAEQGPDGRARFPAPAADVTEAMDLPLR